jgi:endogenous inhibitor of DNA gyrase (YacG/DUF329 family)
VTDGAELPKSFPFCSPRCKSVDLGRWFNEDYKVSRPMSFEEAIEHGIEKEPTD